MPTFDFQCRKCDHVFEFSRPFGSKTHPACPACKSKRTEKLIAPPAVHFKGTGWYKTDSRSPPTSPKVAAKKEDAKKEDLTDGVKPDTKKEKKTSEKGSGDAGVSAAPKNA